MSIEYKFEFKIYQIEVKQNIEARMHLHDLLYTLPLKSIQCMALKLYNYKTCFAVRCACECCSDFPLYFLMNRVLLNAQCCFRFAVRFLAKLCQCNYYCIELTAHSHTCSYTHQNPTQFNSFFLSFFEIANIHR